MIGAGTNIAGVMNVGSAAFPAAARAATLPVVPAGRDVGSRRCFHLSAGELAFMIPDFRTLAVVAYRITIYRFIFSCADPL